MFVPARVMFVLVPVTFRIDAREPVMLYTGAAAIMFPDSVRVVAEVSRRVGVRLIHAPV